MNVSYYDNLLFQKINKMIDGFLLNILWLIVSLPLITLGASTTALYYTVNKVIIHDKGHIWKSFWHSFKGNFKQSTIIELLLLLLLSLMSYDSYIMYQIFTIEGKFAGFYLLFIVAIAFIVIWGCYLITYIARFDDATKTILIKSFKIMIANIGWSVLLLLIVIISCIIIYIFPIGIFVMPTVYMMITNRILEHIFQKYQSQDFRA